MPSLLASTRPIHRSYVPEWLFGPFGVQHPVDTQMNLCNLLQLDLTFTHGPDSGTAVRCPARQPSRSGRLKTPELLSLTSGFLLAIFSGLLMATLYVLSTPRELTAYVLKLGCMAFPSYRHISIISSIRMIGYSIKLSWAQKLQLRFLRLTTEQVGIFLCVLEQHVILARY